MGSAVAHHDADRDRLLLREARGERLVFLKIDALHERLHFAIGDGCIVETFEPGPAVIEDACERERHRKARAETRYDIFAGKARREHIGPDFDALYRIDRQPPARHFREQVLERIDGGVAVAADRVQLEIALRDQPVRAEPGDGEVRIEFVRVDTFTVHVAHAVDFAGETAFDEPRRSEPHESRMAGENIAHGRAVEQCLAARGHSHGRRAIEELERLRRVKTFQHCGCNRRADDAICAMRVEREPHLGRARNARRHLVAERDRAYQFHAAAAAFLRERNGRRHDLDAGMTFRKQIAFVEL